MCVCVYTLHLGLEIDALSAAKERNFLRRREIGGVLLRLEGF